MSKERWSDSKTKSFISCYIEQQSLWNISDPGYALKNNVNNFGANSSSINFLVSILEGASVSENARWVWSDANWSEK